MYYDVDEMNPPFTTSKIYREFSKQLKARTREIPAHLLREEDMRATLRDVLLAKSVEYQDVRNYMAEYKYVDVRLMHRGVTVYIEFKLWHSTLKLDSKNKLASRSRPVSDRDAHEKDLLDLAKRAADEKSPECYFVALTQASRHPQALTASGPWGPWDPGSTLKGMYDLDEGAQTRLSISDGKQRIRVQLDDYWEAKSGGAADWQCKMEFRAIRVLP